MQYFDAKVFIILLFNLHKSFPHHQKVLFDIYKQSLYDVDARREHRFPKEIGGEH